jgi:hypothetical protein
MTSLIDSIWYRIAGIPDEIWQWFAGLNREEWLVVLTIVCACGFLSLRGMQARRL